MLIMNPGRRVALAMATLGVVFFVAPTPTHAIKWGKGERARVVLPKAAEDDPSAPAFRDSSVPEIDKTPGKNSANIERNRKKQASAPKQPEPTPDVAPPTSTKEEAPKEEKKEKKPLLPKKTELQKKQDELDDARKDFDRKKYKKALEKSCQIVSDVREHGYDKVGSDGKGKDARLYKELLDQALSLAEKSGGRVDEPSVPAGATGKILYFMF